MSKLTVMDLLTSSGKFPDREKDPSCNTTVKANALDYTNRVNAFLIDLGVDHTVYSSGFRTAAANASTSNAAKHSLHMECRAGDFIDDAHQTLAHKAMERPDLLRKHGLWLEHPDSTKGEETNWMHLDSSTTRPDRESRVFHP